MTLNKYLFIKKIFLIFVTFQLSASFAQVNNALKFDGVNDYVQLNGLGSQLQNDDSFTIEFWMRADIIGQPIFPVMFAINTNQSTNSAQNILVIQMLTQSGANDGQLYINWENGGAGDFFNTQTQVGDNVCHHIAYTRNGTGPNSSQIFIDGLLIGSFGFNDVSAINATSFFSLGQEFDSGSSMIPSQFYNGTIDDFRVWNYTRTGTEILSDMNTSLLGTETGLLANINFNQGMSSGNNSAISSLTNNTSIAGINGSFVNFGLTGSNSNFILAECTAAANITATTSTTINTNCNGTDCDYTGPSILINELMISPISGDGSISGQAGAPARGEWIELYNPNLCEPADISCFYLGNNTAEGTGGFVIPAGTIVPPAGFAVIRGVNAAAVPAASLVVNGGNVVEIIVPSEITDPGVCCSGTRVWFPNIGGWFAFYNQNGVPQDAVSWATAGSSNGAPCVAALPGCSPVPSLSSYDNIPNDRKNYVSPDNASNHLGNSIRRIPDGGNWSGNAAPTYGICNEICATPGISTCTGTATVTPSGGTGPYSYQWDDSQVQTTQTAIGLCEGTYEVVVTDNLGDSATFQVTIIDLIPTVSLTIQPDACIDDAPISATVSPIASGTQIGLLTGNGLTGTSFNPQTAGIGNSTLTYTFTDENGCFNTATDQITVHPLPIVTIGNNNSPYCLSTTPVTFSLSPTGGILTGAGVTSNQFIPSNAGVGNHILTYSFTNSFGCSNSTTISVVVTSIPSPTLSVPSPLCIHDNPVTMIGTPTGGNYFIDGATSNNQFDPVLQGVGTFNITYTFIDVNNCQASTTQNVTVLPRPSLTIDLLAGYCLGTGIVNLNPTPAGGILSGDNVVGNSLNLNNVPVGNYAVSYQYTDVNGCENTLNSTYGISPELQPSYVYSSDCFQILDLSASPINPNYTYSWQLNGTTFQGANTSLEIQNAGSYNLTLTITDQFNCSFDSVGIVDVAQGVTAQDFVVPNVITPNGDGTNDYLQMSPLLNECFEYSILIVNRWGNKVFEVTNTNNPFRGFDMKGNELTAGVYFYLVKSTDFDCKDEKYKGFCSGNVTIVR